MDQRRRRDREQHVLDLLHLGMVIPKRIARDGVIGEHAFRVLAGRGRFALGTMPLPVSEPDDEWDELSLDFAELG